MNISRGRHPLDLLGPEEFGYFIGSVEYSLDRVAGHAWQGNHEPGIRRETYFGFSPLCQGKNFFRSWMM